MHLSRDTVLSLVTKSIPIILRDENKPAGSFQYIWDGEYGIFVYSYPKSSLTFVMFKDNIKVVYKVGKYELTISKYFQENQENKDISVFCDYLVGKLTEIYNLKKPSLRVSNEKFDEVILEIVKNSTEKNLKPTDVYKKLREIYWDVDENDFRTGISILFSKRKLMLDKNRFLKAL